MSSTVLRNGYGGQVRLVLASPTAVFARLILPLICQLESFEASLQLTQSLFPDTHSVPFPGTFIRAPVRPDLARFSSHIVPPADPLHLQMLLTPSSGPLNASFQVLARLPYSPDPDNEMTGIVAWREGRKMAASFHPELSGEKGDERLHDFWVRQCCFGADADAE